MIVILDYGLGNLGSIKNMLRKIGEDSVISGDPAVVSNATKIILPGIGAFDSGMSHLNRSGLVDLMNEKALVEKIPILGICLGAQLMTNGSEEGQLAGLGWFDAQTVKFRFDGFEGKWPLPNIGWRDVITQNASMLLEGFEKMPRFYFVHSYLMKSNVPAEIAMTTNYALDYVCGMSRDNLHCVQFHPEKSHKFGMQLFRNFVKMS